MSIHVLHRKESIVLTAIDVMNDYGVDALSTKQIAIREGITEGAIYKHFSKKVDIMHAVLEYFAQYDQDINESIEVKQLDPLEAVIYYFEAYGTYYENYPAITVILLSFDQIRYCPDLEEKIKSIFWNRSAFIGGLIYKAQMQGNIKKDIDHELLTDVLFGSFNRICLKWRMQNYQFSLKDKGLQSTKLIVETFRTK